MAAKDYFKWTFLEIAQSNNYDILKSNSAKKNVSH